MKAIVYNPNENDVLFGRGSGAASHCGNGQFRAIVESKKEQYSKASKMGKRIIALSIIEEIKNMNPPGRFLMEDPRNKNKGSIGPWVCVDEDKAIGKVTHCLREKRRPLDVEENVAKSESPSYSTISLPSVSSPLPNLSSNATAPSSKFSIHENNRGTEEVTLREWIRLATSSVDISKCASRSYFSTYGDDISSWPEEIKTSVAVSSESFLMPALKVAISLADQICKAEQEILHSSLERMHSDGGHDLSYLPDTAYDWAARTVVNSTFFGETPLSHSRQDSPSPDLREEQIMPITPDLSSLKSGEDKNDVNTSICFSSIFVSNARILPPLQNISYLQKKVVDDQSRRIYFLGLVFYEIFSGGRQHSSIGDTPDPLGDDPLECVHHDTTIDLNSALKILDELNSDDDFFGESLDEKNGDVCIGNRSEKSYRTWNESRRSNVVSPELLESQQLPNSLATLIENMLDCIDGDFRGDESYNSMKDVKKDLQLMIGKPAKFLHDLDLNRLSRIGLHLDDKMLGREIEFSALRESYQRSVTYGDEFAVISGPSGIGKSMLAETKFAAFVKSTGGIFLTGKFDQLQQTRPYSTISSAFNDYCVNLIDEEGSTSSGRLRSALLKAFGRDVQYLVKLIPSLSKILGPSIQIDSGQTCVDVQKRIEYLLRRFVEVISDSSGAPVTLFLDDLQWADPASVNIIADLLLSSGSLQQTNNFYFLCCVRDEAFDQNHPFQAMISRVKLFGVRLTIVRLSFMCKDDVNEMVSDLLCLSPRLTRPLADIVHHKTKGNPLFVNQLMLSLSKEGSLRFSLVRRRWEWDDEKIQSRELPDDVALLFINAIEQLPPDVKSAMSILSCFGASTDTTLVEALETSLGLKLQGSLDVAVSEGFLDKRDGKYVFCHDRVQEASYNIMDVGDRGFYHFQYGLALCNYTIGNGGEEKLLLTAMDQVNRGGPTALADPGQSEFIASLNLRAGDKAIEMSDIASASEFFRHGISFLRKNHWRDHYDLSLQLHERSATCFLALGDLTNLEVMIKRILEFARSFEDTLNAVYITICSLFNASKLQLVIGKGLSILTQLGEGLPECVSDFQRNTLVAEMIVKLQGMSDCDLLHHKIMTERSKIMALKFLAKLEITMILANHSLYPFVAIKIIELSLLHGMDPLSAIGFVHFGCVLTKIGRFREGFRYVKLARSLVDRFQSKELAGEVMNFSSHVTAFVEPVQSILDLFLQGYTSSLEAGDMSNAAMNFLFHCISMYWVGTRLDSVKESLGKGVRFCKQQNHLNYLSSILPLLRTVTALIGNYKNLQEGYANEEHHLASATRMFQNMHTAFIYRRYDEVKTYADIYFESNRQEWAVLYSVACQTFIGGLVSFWIYRQSNDLEWASRGIRAMSEVKQWAASSEWNFSDKLYLLEAEHFYSTSKFDNALASYNKAIASAKKHKFVNDEALACELAGNFLLETGRREMAQSYMSRALEKYLTWGAYGKVEEMKSTLQDEEFPESSSQNILSFCDTFAEHDESNKKREHEV